MCVIHGGGAPQVKQSASERLASFVDPALSQLIRIVQTGDSDAVQLAAIKDVLDRAIGKPADKQQISGPDGGPIQTEDVGISDDDRAARILAVLERARGRLSGPADGQESDLGSAEGSAD